MYKNHLLIKNVSQWHFYFLCTTTLQCLLVAAAHFGSLENLTEKKTSLVGMHGPVYTYLKGIGKIFINDEGGRGLFCFYPQTPIVCEITW